MEPPGRSEARFGPSVDKVVAARHFASRVVADAGLSHTIHDVALATGELAANAAEHARTPFAVVVDTALDLRRRRRDPPEEAGGELHRCFVADRGAEPPATD